MAKLCSIFDPNCCSEGIGEGVLLTEASASVREISSSSSDPGMCLERDSVPMLGEFSAASNDPTPMSSSEYTGCGGRDMSKLSSSGTTICGFVGAVLRELALDFKDELSSSSLRDAFIVLFDRRKLVFFIVVAVRFGVRCADSDNDLSSTIPESSKAGKDGRDGMSSSCASPSCILRHMRDGVSILKAIVVKQEVARSNSGGLQMCQY